VVRDARGWTFTTGNKREAWEMYKLCTRVYGGAVIEDFETKRQLYPKQLSLLEE
jgi:hypothetical protein